MPRQDVADRIADELAAWLELRSQQVADAILESAYRPRVVEPTKAETVAFFRPLLVTPEGYINEAGKQQIVDQYGARAYEQIAKSVARALESEADETFAAARAEAVAAIEEVSDAGP